MAPRWIARIASKVHSKYNRSSIFNRSSLISNRKIPVKDVEVHEKPEEGPANFEETTVTAKSVHQEDRVTFFDLPGELRNNVYNFYFEDSYHKEEISHVLHFLADLKQIYPLLFHEASSLFWAERPDSQATRWQLDIERPDVLTQLNFIFENLQRQLTYSIEGKSNDSAQPEESFFITYGLYDNVWLNSYQAQKRNHYSPRILRAVNLILLACDLTTLEDIAFRENSNTLPPYFELEYKGDLYNKRFWATYTPPTECRCDRIKFGLTSVEIQFQTEDLSILKQLWDIWHPTDS